MTKNLGVGYNLKRWRTIPCAKLNLYEKIAKQLKKLG